MYVHIHTQTYAYIYIHGRQKLQRRACINDDGRAPQLAVWRLHIMGYIYLRGIYKLYYMTYHISYLCGIYGILHEMWYII